MRSQPTDDFGDLAVRLGGFGLRIFAEFGLGGASSTIPGTGLSIDDFVWKTLENYSEGNLVFEPGKGALVSLLARALRNDIIDALRRAAHVREEARPTQSSDDKEERKNAALDELPSRSIGVDVILDHAAYRERVLRTLADEPELREMADVILDLGLTKPQEIAEAVGITVTEYQNRKKRMRRRLIEFHHEEKAKHESAAND